ncbi:hypothetical protein FRB97_004763 [Tulasnella sp. 331]|nr:hypothetical protein FRB97_004763 [Tulasnella sp. 331]
MLVERLTDDVTATIQVLGTIVEDLQDPEQYVQLVWRTMINRYVCLASTVIVVWDWITNLDDEVAYIWRPRKSAMTGKPLYLFLRYCGMGYQAYDLATNFGAWSTSLFLCGILLLHTIRDCRFYTRLTSFLLTGIALCLYRMNRKLLIFTAAFFCTCCLCTIVLLIMAYEKQFGVIATPAYLTGCWSLLGSLISICAIPGLVFELWLFLMVMYRAITYSNRVGKWKRHSVISMLVADSIGWFVMFVIVKLRPNHFITFMLVVNAVGYEVLPTGLRIVALPTLRGLIIICGCHLILRMRQACCEEDDASIPSTGHHITRSEKLNNSATDVPPSPGLSTTLHGHASGSEPRTPRKLGSFRGTRRQAREKATTSLNVILETTKLGRMLDLAQKFGMPPPLRQDLESMWDDPVKTLNVGAATEIERDVVGENWNLGGPGPAMEMELVQLKRDGQLDKWNNDLQPPRRFRSASFFAPPPPKDSRLDPKSSMTQRGVKEIDVDISFSKGDDPELYATDGDECSVAYISSGRWDELEEHELHEPRIHVSPRPDRERDAASGLDNTPSFLDLMS